MPGLQIDIDSDRLATLDERGRVSGCNKISNHVHHKKQDGQGLGEHETCWSRGRLVFRSQREPLGGVADHGSDWCEGLGYSQDASTA